MKLRMYLRGLGLGILVTAIVLSLSGNTKTETLSDSEIIARAKELGMEEKKTTLAAELINDDSEADSAPDNAGSSISSQGDLSSSSTETVSSLPISSSTEALSAATAKESSSSSSSSSEKEAEVQEAAPDKETEETEPDKEPEESESVNEPEEATSFRKTTITISRGASSDTVARLLEKGGLIDDAARFDKYLCDKDYDNRITTGEHEIPDGATYEEIANIITSK